MSSAELESLVRELGKKFESLSASLVGAPQRYLTIKSAARYADLSEESVRRMISAGKLTAYRPVRGRVLIDRHELDSAIRSSTKAPRSGRGRTSDRSK